MVIEKSAQSIPQANIDRQRKSKVKRCFSNALASYDQHAIAQHQINQYLIDLLYQVKRLKFNHVLEVGCGTGGLTRLLIDHLQVQQWSFNDLCNTESHINLCFQQVHIKEQQKQFYCGDAEQFPFPHHYDLIASASAVQWFHDPQRFIQHCAEHLSPHGILLLSSFVPANLSEIRQLTQVGLDYPSPEQWQRWLTDEFNLIHLQQTEIKLYFNSPLDVLKHLQATGVTGVIPKTNVKTPYWNKTKLIQFLQAYQQHYQNEAQQVSLTYTPIFILAEKRS